MKTTKEHLLEKWRQGLDFVSATHFDDPMYWVGKLPKINDQSDIVQYHLLENRCASIKAPVDLFYNILPRSIFYTLAGVIVVLAFQYPDHNNLILFAIVLGLFTLPHILTIGDYKKFKNCLHTAKIFLIQNCSLQYVNASQREQEKKLITELERTRLKEMGNYSVTKLEKSSPKSRMNYGAVPLALLDNLIRRRVGYDPSTTIDYSDSRENLVKISNIANKIGCKSENIRTELDNFKTIGSLLSQPTSRLKNCLKYLEKIKQSPEYFSNENFKKQTDYLYRQTRLKISKCHKPM